MISAETSIGLLRPIHIRYAWFNYLRSGSKAENDLCGHAERADVTWRRVPEERS